MRNTRITVLILILCSSLAGHRLNIFTQVERDSVVGQCYYNDGTPVRQQKIEIFRLSGGKLMELKTDDEGYFRFAPPVKDDLRIVLYAGMGHKSEITINAADLPEIEKPLIDKPQSSKKTVEKTSESSGLDEERLRTMVEDVLDDRFNSLRELIVKQQKSVMVTTIIGGIGYIFGIFGLVLFLRSRKRK